MTKWKLAGSTAAIALFAGSGAFADVTPEEVWENWRALTTAFGQESSTASVARDGDTLVIADYFTSFDQDGVHFESTIPEMRLMDQGDGTVLITLSESYDVLMTFPGMTAGELDAAAPVSTLEIAVAQPGLAVTASGTAADTAFDFDAPEMTVSLAGYEGDSEEAMFVAEVALTGMAATYLIAGADGAKALTSTFAAQSLAFSMSGNDAETQTTVAASGSVADMAGASNGNLIGLDAMQDMAAALRAGFAIDASYTHGAAEFALEVIESGAPTTISGTLEGGDFKFGLDKVRMLYGTSTRGMALSIASADIPFPELNVAFGEAGFNILMPLMKTDAPTDFAFLTRIVDLTISDEIWGMLDPAAALPHDPATVIIDTKGTVQLTADLVDPAQMETLGDAPPGTINSLEITELRASIAGAELTGAGSFTFDNTDLVTFDGVPAPTGKIDLKLTGGNGLLDKLVAMGMLSEDDANGARMMVSMFANSAADGDELTSTVEFKDKGLFANGMQLQ